MKTVASGRKSLEYTIWNELFQGLPSKGQRTQVSIAEAAIRLYSKQGVHTTTYDLIAKEAKVSRPLVIKYFPAYEDLILFVANYLRAKFQKMVVDRMMEKRGHKAQLAAYVDATFEALEKYPRDAKVWVYLYYKCALDKSYKRLNTALVDVGHRRIQAMIEAGVQEGVFSTQHPSVAARAIQIQITGSLISVLSEDRSKELPQLIAQTHRAVLQLAGVLVH